MLSEVEGNMDADGFLHRGLPLHQARCRGNSHVGHLLHSSQNPKSVGSSGGHWYPER